MKWLLKLVAAGGEGPWVDVMEISKPDGLVGLASFATSTRARAYCGENGDVESAELDRQLSLSMPFNFVGKLAQDRDHYVPGVTRCNLKEMMSWEINKLASRIYAMSKSRPAAQREERIPATIAGLFR